MNTQQPKALLLADEIGTQVFFSREEAASELRRLHLVNAELLEALNRIADPRNTHFVGDAQVVARAVLARLNKAQE